MNLGACVLLNLVLKSCSGGEQAKPKQETEGPVPELRKQYHVAPADLHNLNAVLVEKQAETQFQSYFMNISWSLSTDANVKELTATKISVNSKGIIEHFQCIRCYYTEKFQSQTAAGNQGWQFYYIGFPVEPETKYFIQAYNLPPANINDDFPSKSLLLTTPGCNDNVMKYSKSCIEMGSLWNPNITVRKIETGLEVNFTTSSLGLEYLILLYECQNYEVLLEKNVEANVIFYILTINSVGRFVSSPCCSTCSCIYYCCGSLYPYKARTDTFRRQFFHQVRLQLHVKVLVIYPVLCLNHTVLSFAEFLHEGCQTDVILDLWERRRIAEKGPVACLAAQKAAADRVIFLSSNPTTAACDGACKSVRNYSNTESMFSLALLQNRFCSDMTNRSSVQKYMVVSFNEVNAQDTLPSALNICPKYCLMKDMKNFYRDLSVSYN
ncbi:LOW QUALITY PROTEIN: interleukin-17 receptor B [Anser cygnoides]|uniref:LOW QUALITY PROTEIN: interleukin-17 receptor B n=1 Tax=Anser cygnoides TaxID=8845 RepID=UPI0034D16BAB